MENMPAILPNSDNRKLNFDMRFIKELLAVSSIIFIVSGYIYNKIFLCFFGMDSNVFFSVIDYITSATDNTITEGISILIVFFILVKFQQKHNIEDKIMHFSKTDYKPSWKTVVAVLPIIILPYIIMLFIHKPYLYYFLIFLGFLLALLLGSLFLTYISFQFFQEPKRVLFFLYLTFLFLLMVITDALNHAVSCKYGTYEVFGAKNFIFSGINIEKDEKLVLFNSNYYFFFNKKSNTMYIYDRNKVNLVKSKPHQKGSIENRNGVISTVFPGNHDIACVNQEDIKQVLDNINQRPMKYLN